MFFMFRQTVTILLAAVFAAQTSLVADAGACDHREGDCPAINAVQHVSSKAQRSACGDTPGQVRCQHEGHAPERQPTAPQPEDVPCDCPLNCCVHSTTLSFLPIHSSELFAWDVDLGLAGVDCRQRCPSAVLLLLVPPPEFRVLT